MIFSVTNFNVDVSTSKLISVLNPGFSLILISDFLTPLSTCNSLAKFLTSSTACLWSRSSEKFSNKACIISSPLNPCSDFSSIKAS